MKYYKLRNPYIKGFLFSNIDPEDNIFREDSLVISELKPFGLFPLFDEVTEKEWVDQEIKTGRLIELPESWCVKGDKSKLFIDTVIHYLNKLFLKGYYDGTSYDYYGLSDKKCFRYYDKSAFAKNTIELTLSQFIKLSGYNIKLTDKAFENVLKAEKPPIGLKPKDIFDNQVRDERLKEISEAISRYLYKSLSIDISWVEEYNEIVKSLNNK